MTARDERLEAAVKALREQGYDGPTAYRYAAAGIIVGDAVRAFDEQQTVRHLADRQRQSNAVQETQPPAVNPVGADYVGWRCGKCNAPIAGRFSICKCGHGSGIQQEHPPIVGNTSGIYGIDKDGRWQTLDRQSVDQDPRSTAIGAEPPWLDEAKDALWMHHGLPGSDAREIIWRIMLIYNRFAAAQPPSEAEMEEAASELVDSIIYDSELDAMTAARRVARAALLAAARVRAGG